MKKLLHERLRDITEPDSIYVDDVEVYLYQAPAEALADEIEKDYIPREDHEREVKELIEAQGGTFPSAHHIMQTWAKNKGMTWNKGESITNFLDRYYIPRHTDSEGNPWLIGDKAIDGEGEEFVVQGYGYEDDYPYLVNVYSGTIHDGQWCTRPSPKAYTADGVEIKAGDAVYDANGALQIIEHIHKNGYVSTTLLDFVNPKELTSKEPDSLEKLRDDMRSFGEVGADCTSDCCLQYADRLTALIERVG